MQATHINDVNMRITLRRMSDEATARGDSPLAAILEVAIRTLDERIARHMQPDESMGGLRIRTELVTRNIRISDRRTTIKLEQDYWDALDRIAQRNSTTVDALCTIISNLHDGGNMTSAIRVYVLNAVETQEDEVH